MNYRVFIEYSTSQKNPWNYLRTYSWLCPTVIRCTTQAVLTKRSNVEHNVRRRDIGDCQSSHFDWAKSQRALEQSLRFLKHYFYACSGLSA